MARIALSKIRFLKIKRLPAWKKKNLNAVPSFSDMGLRQDVLESLKSMNIVEPTWVQVSRLSSSFCTQYQTIQPYMVYNADRSCSIVCICVITL